MAPTDNHAPSPADNTPNAPAGTPQSDLQQPAYTALTARDRRELEGILKDPPRAEILGKWIEAKAIDPDTRIRGVPALSVALANRNNAAARTLMAKGANVNAYADRNSEARGLAPIHFAKGEGIELLVKAKADLDAPITARTTKGNTALTTAAGTGDLERAQALRAAGADDTKLIIGFKRNNSPDVEGGMTAAQKMADLQAERVQEAETRTSRRSH